MPHDSVSTTLDFFAAYPAPVRSAGAFHACHVVAPTRLHSMYPTLGALLRICQCSSLHFLHLFGNLSAVFITRFASMCIWMVVTEITATLWAYHLWIDLTLQHLWSTKMTTLGAFSNGVVFTHHFEALVLSKSFDIRKLQDLVISQMCTTVYHGTTAAAETENMSRFHAFFDPVACAIFAAIMGVISAFSEVRSVLHRHIRETNLTLKGLLCPVHDVQCWALSVFDIRPTQDCINSSGYSFAWKYYVIMYLFLLVTVKTLAHSKLRWKWINSHSRFSSKFLSIFPRIS